MVTRCDVALGNITIKLTTRPITTIEQGMTLTEQAVPEWLLYF